MANEDINTINRFLYTRSSKPGKLLFPLKDVPSSDFSLLTGVVTRVSDGAGQATLALQHCLAANQKPGLCDRRALILILSACLKVDVKSVRTAVYSELSSLIYSSEDLFEFIYLHNRIFKKRPKGFGGGMKRLISRWYLEQEPLSLALEVCRLPRAHQWSHRDLVHLARVTSSQPPMAAVLTFIMRGLAAAKSQWESKPEAAGVLEALSQCVSLRTGGVEPDVAAASLASTGLEFQSIPTGLLHSQQVWGAWVETMSVRQALNHLKSLSRRGFLKDANSHVLVKLIEMMKKPLAAVSANLQPAELVSIVNQVSHGWSPPPGASFPACPAPHPSLTTALQALLPGSLQTVAKTGGNILVAIDTRPQMRTQGCWGLHSLRCNRATATILLSLMAADSNLTVAATSSVEGTGRLQQIVMEREVQTLESIDEKLEPTSGGLVTLPQLFHFAATHIESQEFNKFDSIIVINHSDQRYPEDEVTLFIQGFKNVTYKFIFCGLANKSPKLPETMTDPDILEICGWDPTIVRAIQSFSSKLF